MPHVPTKSNDAAALTTDKLSRASGRRPYHPPFIVDLEQTETHGKVIVPYEGTTLMNTGPS